MSRVLPILFNTDMVRAILDGRKTATRRIVKPQPKEALVYCFAGSCFGTWGYPWKLGEPLRRWNPPCHAEDILYVRETWTYHEGAVGGVIFKARCPEKLAKNKKWRPSIHMPKEAARIWLKVTTVRVEHLQDMSTDDFLSEGVTIRPEAYNDPENAYQQAKEDFKNIWDSTIKKADRGKYGWEANPWVWVIGFERCEKPEEERQYRCQ